MHFTSDLLEEEEDLIENEVRDPLEVRLPPRQEVDQPGGGGSLLTEKRASLTFLERKDYGSNARERDTNRRLVDFCITQL